MKKLNLLLLLCAVLTLSSCEKDDNTNSEADIKSLYFAPEDNVKLIGTPVITNSRITFFVLPGDDGLMLAPQFTLSKGAKISPASGTELDFSQPQVYKVTSEDGKWSKEYTVAVSMDMKLKYDFENFESSKGYDEFYERAYINTDKGTQENLQYIWASGNSGIALIMSGKPASDYPTSAAEMIGPTGETTTVARMVTRSTGILGSLVEMPIAAGNLFIGWFNSSKAMGDALAATEFGFPVNKKPVAIKGWYRYVSGTKDYNGNEVYPANAPDSCSIYAVLYKSDENGTRLDGSNILTSDRVVAKAIFKEPAQTLDGQWKPFENNEGDGQINFEYVTDIDQEALEQYKYNLAVVFSSSYKGAEFKGAIDSELLIDDVEVIVE